MSRHASRVTRHGSNRICVIEGDGIGHEVVPAAVEALRTVASDLEFVPAEAGFECFEKRGVAIPEETWAAIDASDGILFGAISAPSEDVPGYEPVILTLRQRLRLYANLRPTVSPPLRDLRQGVDLLIVRENTEGLYVRTEWGDEGSAVALRVITREASARIARLAFELARKRRKKVTVVHKANVLRKTCGLFRAVALEVARDYPDVEAEEMLVDAMAMWLAKAPERFDVVLTPNLFGDILSDEASVWGGGLGMAPSLNLGDGPPLAEPVHGSAPDIAGKGIANPVAALLSAAMLLEVGLGREREGKRLREAVWAVLGAGYHTPDLPGEEGKTVTTAEFGKLVCAYLRGEPWG